MLYFFSGVFSRVAHSRGPRSSVRITAQRWLCLQTAIADAAKNCKDWCIPVASYRYTQPSTCVLAALRTKPDKTRPWQTLCFIHFLQTEHRCALMWYAQFYILISWVTSWKVAVPLRLTQLCLRSDVLVFVSFWGVVYMPITLPLFWSSPSLRNYEAP